MAATPCRGDPPRHSSRTRRLPQECLGQGASTGRVLLHRDPRYNSAPNQPLLQVLCHDQQGHTLQLPRPWRRAGLSGPLLSHSACPR
ncbi:NADH dehydrogenase [ubiquinone] 1 alpha subcomplex subunit 3 isoform X2 [Sapajus apella]|uniref:NADH dehydrogenase [ubiquinone] 1 alpha subcomplex subunit 3 isoform X2 n=1 Tax=Sapajus apella TaxID=9515 RepID=A0A6J3HAG7_SAPAP|nr:NADH dehydrogenase [ubiquinone] 1 alpha subcomplex subunit 3 isoform X2 [Sapajus apella]